MKIAAIIIGFSGLWDMMYLPKAFHLADNPKWLLDVWISISGILSLFFSAGIWTRRVFAWYLGWLYIVSVPLGFLTGVCRTLPAVSTGKKAIIISSCSVFVILFIVFWSVVWCRQKKWFSHERVA
jgi:hypothetical protein